MGRKNKERRALKSKAKKKASLRDKQKRLASQKSKKNESTLIDDQKILAELKQLLDPLRLTTPEEINNDIRVFCKQISNLEPFFIDSTPEPWSRQSCCNLNVNEYISLNGGEMVCGYKIWASPPNYLEAERHALWLKDGEYRDVSFNSDGETRILFLPDIPERQKEYELNNIRIRWGKNKRTKELIEFQEKYETSIQSQKMDYSEAWNTMLTYEQWQNGERMPSFIPKLTSA